MAGSAKKKKNSCTRNGVLRMSSMYALTTQRTGFGPDVLPQVIGGLGDRREAGPDQRGPVGLVESDEAEVRAELPAEAGHRSGHAQRDHRVARQHRRRALAGAALQIAQRLLQRVVAGLLD